MCLSDSAALTFIHKQCIRMQLYGKVDGGTFTRIKQSERLIREACLLQ